MNDLVKDCRITGNVLLDGEDVYRDLDINKLRKKWVWYSKTKSIPNEHL